MLGEEEIDRLHHSEVVMMLLLAAIFARNVA